MTRLWNHKPDNMAACRSKEREFLPSLENYFEEAIMQADPAAMIEPQYKCVFIRVLKILQKHWILIESVLFQYQESERNRFRLARLTFIISKMPLLFRSKQ